MRHEKIIKRQSGEQIMIVVNAYMESLGADAGMHYSTTVKYRAKGKRLWESSCDHNGFSYRRLEPKQQLEYEHTMNLAHASAEEIHQAKLELWEKLKPTV